MLPVSVGSASIPRPYPGLHPLPPRTGHEVCPHPALRQPSAWSIQSSALSIPTTTDHIRQGHAVLHFLALKPGQRLSSRDLSKGGISPTGHAPSLTSSLDPVEAEALPSHPVLLSWWSTVLWPPPTSHQASGWTSLLQLIPVITVGVGHRPDETSPVPSPTVATSRSPYAGGFLAAAFPGSSPLPWPSLCMRSSAPSFSLSG